MIRVDESVALDAYLEGVDALMSVGRRFGSADWQRQSACPGWDASALAGHVLCVVRWHHEWLDRAEEGNASTPWPPSELAARNEAGIKSLEIPDGTERLHLFAAEAHRYAQRLPASWELPFWYPGGVVTAGLHAVLAAGEWHLHAWDLGQAIGFDHEPDAGAIRTAWVSLGRKVDPDSDAWAALLIASERVANS